METPGVREPIVQEHSESSPRDKRVLRVDQIWSTKDRKHFLYKTRKEWSQKTKEPKWTIVVRRVFNSNGRVGDIFVEIRSPQLAAVVGHDLEDVPGHGMANDPPTLPRELFFHLRGSLEDALRAEENSKDPNLSLLSDIQLALDFHKDEYALELISLESLLRSGEITYELLWTIFPPHCQLYSEQNILQEPQVYNFVTRRNFDANDGLPPPMLPPGLLPSSDRGGRNPRQKGQDIVGKFLHFDGENIGWVEAEISIFEYQGAKKINSLAIYPLMYHSNEQNVKDTMTQQARTYIQLLQPSCREYEGFATHMVSEGPRWLSKRFPSTGKIMVDAAGFRTMNPDVGGMNELLSSPPVDLEKLSGRDKLTFSSTMLGFSFKEKEWGRFALSKISDVKWNQSAFGKVIMAESKRDIIQALVQSHLGHKSPFDDIVEGKGKGLVGLLSGGPGVGKSLTAEAVSEFCKKPLLTITSSDLNARPSRSAGVGLDPYSSLERNLRMFLDYTKRWDCVLLIDEADVYLQKRKIQDLSVNSLVSAFLRQLEYCQGIVFMTTNRCDDMDEAFKSRIHFQFDYPDLEAEQRYLIWKNFLEGASSYTQGLHLSEESLRELAEIPLNGREIRNTCSCVSTLAEARKSGWSFELIKEVLSVLHNR